MALDGASIHHSPLRPSSQAPLSELPSLGQLFEAINLRHFDGFMEAPILRWNPRLRSSAGRFIPGRRKFLREGLPVIEIASYLRTEAAALAHIEDTLAHEMIHYWLWLRRRPFGHTPEFYSKMQAMGVSRYNPVPRRRPEKYLYHCSFCRKEFRARRKLGELACADCCRQHGSGAYDARFRLVLAEILT